MADELNLYQKLAKIRKSVEVVQKNKSGYGYKYVTDDELLAKITAGMDRHGVSLIPRIIPGTMVVEPYTYKKMKRDKRRDGTVDTYEETVNEFISHADMVYEWVNNDNPEERIEVEWVTVGQQGDASQCLGSGLTYSMRYFLLKYFNVATPDDDPDAWRSKQKATEAEEDKAIARQIIDSLDSKVRDYLEKNPDKGADVKKAMSKYVTGGNYLMVTESAIAAKLVEEFEKKFNKEK